MKKKNRRRKKRRLRVGRIIIFILFVIVIVAVILFLLLGLGKKINKGNGTTKKVKNIIKRDEKEKNYKVSVITAGDNLIHQSVYNDAAVGYNEYNFIPMYELIKPISSKIRGGTDGATFSKMGLVTPNLGTGSYNHHGRFEYLDINEFNKMIDVVLDIIKL